MLTRATPWPRPKIEDCYFYHFYNLKDGSEVGGPDPAFDLRGNFQNYVGNIPLRGKSVFDFGTASGFLAFNAEKAGATSVTAFDTKSAYYQQRVPFENYLYLTDKPRWSDDLAAGFKRMNNSFWYIWHEYSSSVTMVYGHDEDLISTQERFDVVIAGAVMEHLSDPVTALGLCAKLANESIVLAFTPVFFEEDEYMKPLVPWDSVDRSYVWWGLSAGLYKRVLHNLGFDLEFKEVSAMLVEGQTRTIIPRQTIIASRR